MSVSSSVIDYLWLSESHLNKHEMLIQRWFNSGPGSTFRIWTLKLKILRLVYITHLPYVICTIVAFVRHLLCDLLYFAFMRHSCDLHHFPVHVVTFAIVV